MRDHKNKLKAGDGAQFPMFCDWCRKKGKDKVIGFSPTEGSSGICQECADDLCSRLDEETAFEEAMNWKKTNDSAVALCGFKIK